MAVQMIDPWRVIPAEEFRARQERVRETAASQGLDAAVVYSRGGAFMDMSADVLYLTNHYSQQPYMGDDAGVGTARSHGVVIVPVDGPDDRRGGYPVVAARPGGRRRRSGRRSTSPERRQRPWPISG